MNKLLFYICIILLVLYIISPLDAYPLFLDDIIATVILIYLIYKNRGMKTEQRAEYADKKETDLGEVVTVDDALRILGVRPNSTWEEIKKAYKEKIVMNHPDKVNHLSKELQDRAKELTLNINRAFEIIKKHRDMN